MKITTKQTFKYVLQLESIYLYKILRSICTNKCTDKRMAKIVIYIVSCIMFIFLWIYSCFCLWILVSTFSELIWYECQSALQFTLVPL